jgi:hypothetical protein
MARFFASFLMNTLTVVCKLFAGVHVSGEKGEWVQTGHSVAARVSLPEGLSQSLIHDMTKDGDTHSNHKSCCRNMAASPRRWLACRMLRSEASQVWTQLQVSCSSISACPCRACLIPLSTDRANSSEAGLSAELAI